MKSLKECLISQKSRHHQPIQCMMSMKPVGFQRSFGSYVISRERFIPIDRLLPVRRCEKMSLKRRSTTKKSSIRKKIRIVQLAVYRSCTETSPQKAVSSKLAGSIQVSKCSKGKRSVLILMMKQSQQLTIIPYKKDMS